MHFLAISNISSKIDNLHMLKITFPVVKLNSETTYPPILYPY